VRNAKLGTCDTSDLCSAILRAGEDSYQAAVSEHSARVVLIVDGLSDSDAALLAEGGTDATYVGIHTFGQTPYMASFIWRLLHAPYIACGASTLVWGLMLQMLYTTHFLDKNV
jgi:hypothetical protein